MVDQHSFMETINSVKEIIKVAQTPMSDDEILSYFSDMELDLAQKQLVLEYLCNPENYKEENEVSDVNRESVSTDTEKEALGVDVFGMYLEEIERLPKYSEEELLEHYRMLLQGDAGRIEQISAAWLPKIIEIAKSYLEPKLLLEDLVQEGNMALFLTLQELCGSMSKADMEETLATAIERGIISYVMELRDAHEMEDSLVGKVSLVHAAEKLLTEENGVVPTLDELEAYTKISKEELIELKGIMDEANKKDA